MTQQPLFTRSLVPFGRYRNLLTFDQLAQQQMGYCLWILSEKEESKEPDEYPQTTKLIREVTNKYFNTCYVIPWGKYKDKKLAEIKDISYIENWLLKSDYLNPIVKQYLQQYLDSLVDFQFEKGQFKGQMASTVPTAYLVRVQDHQPTITGKKVIKRILVRRLNEQQKNVTSTITPF